MGTEELMWSQKESRRFKTDRNKFLKLQSVTPKTQVTNVIIADIHELFDCVVGEFRMTSSRLPIIASNLLTSTFESALVKTQRKNPVVLLREK